MKTFWIISCKKFIIITIFLTLFLIVFVSCQKNNEKPETGRENKEFLQEQKSPDNSEDNEDKLFPDDSEKLPPKFKDMSNLYKSIDQSLLYKYEDIYIPFTNPALPNAKWYRYNPLTNKWYSFNPDNGKEHEIERFICLKI